MKPWRRLRRRVCATATIAGVLVGLGATASDPVEGVEAAWTGTQSATAAVSAATLTAPTGLTCEMHGQGTLIVLLDSVTIRWKSESASPDDFVIGVVSGGNNSPAEPNFDTTITAVPGQPDTYQATISIGLLDSLLVGLLGGSASIGVASTAGTSWRSPWGEVRLSVPLAGILLGSTCAPK